MRKPLSVKPALLAALVLTGAAAGCGGESPSFPGVVTYRENLTFYSPSDYVYVATSQSDFPVDVRNNPFPVPQAEFRQAVVDAMQGKVTWGPPANFTVHPEGETHHWRIVLDFGTSPGVDAQALCRELPGLNGVFEGRPIVVAAAFCTGERALSRLVASVPDISGPQDRRLDSLMGQVVGQLLPPENPHLRNDGDGGIFRW